MKFNKQQWSWILYDPACSAHALIVRTLFAAIFLEVCVDGQFEASKITSMWASTASFACLFAGAIAVLSGPWVDAKKYKVPALIISSAICILSCFAYLFCHQGDWIAVLAISFAGIASFAVASSFYDSLLLDISPPQERNAISTTGFALGYAGAIVVAIICLPLTFLLKGDLSLRISFAIAGTWFALLALPAFLRVRESDRPVERPKRLTETFAFIWQQKNILIFLIAYLLYIDSVGTIMFAAAPLATGLKISTEYLLITILGLQFLGLPFTLLYGHLAKKIPERKLIYCAIAVYMIIAILAGVMSFVPSLKVRQILFVIIAFLVGTSQGGIQALSRSLFSKLIPPDRAAELFSVYNIFGRFTTIIGPLLMIPLAVWLWNRAELGITLMLLPAAIGFILLRKVQIPGEK